MSDLFKVFAAILLLAGLILKPASAHAETVVQSLASSLPAEADYVRGNADRPAVLILHGFLATSRFHTVRFMASALQDAGYTTLTPTLTLGIGQRKQSLKCNAIHTHTLEDDVNEIIDWITWLKKKGHREIVLIGHSSGSQELLALLEKKSDPAVKLAIFTSLFYLNGPELGTKAKEIERAQRAPKIPQTPPQEFSFLFCKKNYLATPESFLSYQKVTRNYVLDQLRAMSIPSYTIMGSADKRYGSVGLNWLDELEASPTRLIIIEGANHFFSSEYEFDLQDHLIAILKAQFK